MAKPVFRPDQQAVRAHYRGLARGYRARANRTCEQTYLRLVRRWVQGRRAVLELGGGSSDLLDRLGVPFAVACDLSPEMLLARDPNPDVARVAAVAERLPFADGAFDGVFLINVLEHVTDLDAVLRESARVLRAGGTWVAVTPNGDLLIS
jgi:demethylmenaquinone methyltransferase/2-methoxy-6-polyprenyl-1,4-benzoquinol methylase